MAAATERTFDAVLRDAPFLANAIGQLSLTAKQTEALKLLDAAGLSGIQIARDASKRLNGPTIRELSRMGAALTRRVGIGPRDAVMWFGTTRMREGREYWVMRPEMRDAFRSGASEQPSADQPDWVAQVISAADHVEAGLGTVKSAALLVSAEFGLNINSVRQMIWAYRQLVHGRVFKRTLSAEVLRKFLMHIYGQGGAEPLKTAITSLELHMAYWEGHYGRPKHEFALIRDYFSALLDADGRIPPFDIDAAAAEGRRAVVIHLRRERNAAIVRAKRDSARLADGSLECEACGANSLRSFPTLGVDIWEVHHRIPLSTIESSTSTSLADLAILCPTCHRAIHRTDPFLAVGEFRAQFFSDPDAPAIRRSR
jgi:predicted HNH restriction endonuclease